MIKVKLKCGLCGHDGVINPENYTCWLLCPKCKAEAYKVKNDKGTHNLKWRVR